MRFVCAVALVFVGFAHQVPATDSLSGPINLSEYVLPDGTLPVLCITDNGDGSQAPGKMHMVHGCEACHIGASVLLPSPADITGHAMQFAAAIVSHDETDTFFRPLFPPNTGPRGPPSGSMTA